ncbi:MAG: PQQ-dependent sugar dehydrogenase [Dehalococcoidia bacterium]|nr:PQQ-dependent sugar dehydrogenase [Dehalococcoidia bacterium]
MRRGLLLTAAALASLLLLACSSGDDGPEDETTAEATSTTSTPASATATATESPVATNAPRPTATFPPIVDPVPVGVTPAYETVVLGHPVEVLSYPLGGYEIALADQQGMIVGVREGQSFDLLDLTDRVLTGGSEEGLLSVALDPQFSTNRNVWIYYSAPDPRRTVLSRFTAREDGTIDPGSELVVLEQDQPASNHNGGAVRFGPDGMLYLGLGDGGNQGDPDENGQDLGTLLGKIIRLDVTGASEAEPYAIPDDNPFVGEQGARGEIYAYGLRNPWRMSFDPATGDLWVGDVGQGDIEEVDRVSAGDNLGWNQMEGDECYRDGCDPSQFVAPVATYTHEGGRCSVTGGVVARHSAAVSVEGAYIYGDYCSGELWAVRSDTTGDQQPVLIADGLGNISSISQVGNQVYILVFGEPMYRLIDQ